MAKKAAAQQAEAAPAAAALPAVAAAPATTASAATGQLKLDDLVWMRDTFANGLLNLESGVRELRLAYLKHFNSLLPDNHPSRLDPTFLFASGPSFDAALPSGLNTGMVTTGLAGAPGSNTKRKRKPHDPNAPKRALTSYFLFMQSNKPSIKQENPGWTAQQVSDESERRWANISSPEKAKYEYMYNVDLARYYKQKEEYDTGKPIPEITPEEAQRLYEEHLRTGALIKGRKGRKVLESAAAAGENVPASASAGLDNGSEDDEDDHENPQLAAADNDAEADDDEDVESDEPPPKKQKAKASAKTTPAKSAVKKSDSPEKKKNPRGKKAAQADDSDNSLVEDTPADKKKGKKAPAKRKSGKSE